MRILRHLLLAASLLFTTGCVSTIIAGSGKSYSHLEDPKVTVAQVRKELGDPIFSRSYCPPQRINETRVYRDRASESPGFPPVVIARQSGSGFSYGEKHYAALCEVYNPRGWYAERDTQAYAMVGAMTLGIGDVAMIPGTLSRKASALSDGVFVTFWYDTNGNYVATHSHDISAIRKKTSATE